MQWTKAAALLIALVIPGCKAFETQVPGTSLQIEKLPRVSNSTKSPCWQQREIAAQNSYIATIESKQEQVYKAPCDVDQPKRVASSEAKS